MDAILTDLNQRMAKAIEVLSKDFQKVRTGRANPAMLEGISVDYYGTPTPLNQIGNVSVPDPQTIVIAPWEKSILSEVEKAILKADLGVTPQNDGSIIRLPVPPLTEDRRKDLVKQVKKLGEDSKLAVRNIRRDGNEKLKKLEKNKEISQDDEKQQLARIQASTDDHIKRIDSLIEAKEKELMAV